MPDSIDSAAQGGVDYGWVLQVTFVLAVIVGAPLATVLSLGADLPTWTARLSFAIRVGAVVWLVVGVGVYAYARLTRA